MIVKIIQKLQHLIDIIDIDINNYLNADEDCYEGTSYRENEKTVKFLESIGHKLGDLPETPEEVLSLLNLMGRSITPVYRREWKRSSCKPVTSKHIRNTSIYKYIIRK